jgi:hypothetical protein
LIRRFWKEGLCRDRRISLTLPSPMERVLKVSSFGGDLEEA